MHLQDDLHFYLLVLDHVQIPLLLIQVSHTAVKVMQVEIQTHLRIN